jgi:type II secretory pathway predicted ATPase ExeA
MRTWLVSVSGNRLEEARCLGGAARCRRRPGPTRHQII